MLDYACCTRPPGAAGHRWSEIYLDLRLPLGGKKVNSFCKSHRKVQRELNKWDTGMHFIVKSHGTALGKDKYRLSGKKKEVSDVK